MKNKALMVFVLAAVASLVVGFTAGVEKYHHRSVRIVPHVQGDAAWADELRSAGDSGYRLVTVVPEGVGYRLFFSKP